MEHLRAAYTLTEAAGRSAACRTCRSSGIWAGVDRLGTETHNFAFLPEPYTAEQLSSAILALVTPEDNDWDRLDRSN